MDPVTIGALISGGASILGGLLGESGKQKELAFQKKLAEQGIRMRVADAQAAGIHPAIALGASVPSYSPVGLGSSMAEGVAGAGQDISRAIAATQTLPERTDAFTQTLNGLQLERAGLENELLKVQILGLTRPATPPFPMGTADYPIPGQPASASIRTPGFGDKMKVTTPGAAQQAEDNYGEVVGWGYGAAAFIEDLLKSLGAEWRPGTRDYSRKSPHYK